MKKLAAEQNPGTSLPDLREVLWRDGLLQSRDAVLIPLGGGVSSEIYRVEDKGRDGDKEGDRTLVVKRALDRLNVKEEWSADPSRNRYEQRYIKYVAEFLPQAVPALVSTREDLGYFAMEYFGPQFANWKQLLLAGDARIEHADRAGAVLGEIHAHSAGDTEAKLQFDSTANFVQLRVDPYLRAAASRNPDLRPILEAESQRLISTRECLVHGDFSPKNILVYESRMVLLDCEVAWYGDGAFDVAFLLTHFLLKALYHAPRQIGLKEMCRAFWHRYSAQTNHVFNMESFQLRVARLLPMLLLARVDGKSPVEYLSGPEQTGWVRGFARSKLLAGRFCLDEILREWFTCLYDRKEPS